LGEAARRDKGCADDVDSGRAWAVAARVESPDGQVNLGTGREAAAGNGAERRLVHVDGRPRKSQTALAEFLSVHWLTPRMDRLFSDGAASRRRFVDRLVFGADPAHAGRVSAYTHALRERAKLLRQGRAGGRADSDWLSALEDAMAGKGVAVAAARREMISRLNAVSAAKTGPFPGAGLALKGDVESWLEEGPALEAEDRLRAALVKARRVDGESGGASVGAHRSDLKVRHLAKECPAERCSTGEQKALLIAIILANARLQARERGVVPILLLDEVAAHLDGHRREALFAEVLALGSQAWLTGVDADVFSDLRGEAQFFSIDDAVVTPGDE